MRISDLERRVSVLENDFRSRVSELDHRISVLENDSKSIKPAHEKAFEKILERTADGTTDEIYDKADEMAKAAIVRVRAEEKLIAAAAIARMREAEVKEKTEWMSLQLLRHEAQNER